MCPYNDDATPLSTLEASLNGKECLLLPMVKLHGTWHSKRFIIAAWTAGLQMMCLSHKAWQQVSRETL